jgi:hypothetical protein
LGVPYRIRARGETAQSDAMFPQSEVASLRFSETGVACCGAAPVDAHALRGEETVADVTVKSSKIFSESRTAQDFDCLTDCEVYPLFSFHLFDVKDAA